MGTKTKDTDAIE